MKNRNIREIFFLAIIVIILGFSGGIMLKQRSTLHRFSDQISYQELVDTWFQNNQMFSKLLIGGVLNENGISTNYSGNNEIALILSDHTCQSCMEAELKRLKRAELENKIHIYCVFESKRKFKTFSEFELKDFPYVNLINCEETTWNYLKDPIYCVMANRRVISVFSVNPKLYGLTDIWLNEIYR